jgi:5'-nucleotidase
LIDVSPVNRLVDRSDATMTAAIASAPQVQNLVNAYKGAV